MKKRHLISFILIMLFHLVISQQVIVSDHLTADFHAQRRTALREKMPTNSVALFFANPIRNRANDVDYIYHQDPNLYYLTGHNEPHALLLIFKEGQVFTDHEVSEVLFTRGHDALKELYNGPRMGVEGAKSKLGIQLVYEGTVFEDFNLDFSTFDKVLFYDFKNDVLDTQEQGDLFDLMSWTQSKIGYQQDLMMIEPIQNNIDVKALDVIIKDMRGIKEVEEITLIKKAVDISTIAQAEVMKAMRPGMSESEIKGLHEYIFKRYQAEFEGYPSIVGAGHNGCVLHYIENNKSSLIDGELILMDLAAEYNGYTADITRTIPVNGTFSTDQRRIYDLVYEAQEAAAQLCKAGLKFSELYDATAVVINNGLHNLGIYKGTQPDDIVNPETGRNRYYPHGCCHHIGLDVHDKGNYNLLEENMVITIEPGIYIPKDSPSDPRWWDLAVRIEDDYLVTAEGCQLLSDKAPRKASDIEALMKIKSPLDDFILPSLEGN